MKRICLWGFVAACGFSAASNDAADTALERYLSQPQSRFQAFEPNYGVWQWTDEDDDSLEAHYSFKYLMSTPDCHRETDRAANGKFAKCVDRYDKRLETFLTYTGEFDFYFGTRHSSPVINRISNPALHMRKYLGSRVSGPASMKYVDLGIQHFSNGQTEDAEAMLPDGSFEAQSIYVADPGHPYFDEVSRDLNFVSIEASLRLWENADLDPNPRNERCVGERSWKCWDVWIRWIPWYETDDNPVTWGPDAGRRHVADYERVRLILSKNIALRPPAGSIGIRELEFSAKWTVGDDLLDTDSLELSFYFPLQLRSRWSLPLFVECHFGPMNKLSDYTREQDSCGFGFRFY